MIRARRLAGDLGVAAIVVLAAIAVATAPGSEQIAAPIEIVGEPGRTVETRSLDVTVTGVTAAATLAPTYAEIPGSTRTTGVWVVVEATVEPTFSNVGFTQTELHVGDVRYVVSPLLPSPSITTLYYSPGVPVAGSLAFEVPTSALTAPGADAARVVFRSGFSAVPDAMAVVVIDLTGLEPSGAAEIDAAKAVDR